MRPVPLALAAALAVAAYAPTLSDAGKLPASPVAAARDTEPVVLTGSQLGTWSVPANQTVKLPLADLAGSDKCAVNVQTDPSKIHPPAPGSYNPATGGVGIPDPTGPTGGAISYDPNSCPPQDYTPPDADTADTQNGIVHGTPTDRILGYRWDNKTGAFRQIPLQVDEVFTRYLNNSRSGFALYSGEDQHTTYAYDREGFRYTDNTADDPCGAIPRKVGDTRLKAMPDPVPGLDSNDEVAFMYSDAGPRAPQGQALPDGIQDAKLVALADPFGTSKPKYVYVMRSTATGPKPAYTAANGYVKYVRDANADRFAESHSSYADYGNAPPGPYCDPQTGKLAGTGQRRPLDTATVSTKRYRFRYDGRWLLTKLEISPDNGDSYGPDLVDRWKARAFAQDPSSKTPCCGYEEEDSNWGGSSITLGERVGPVRAIRETWGADSGTNVIRRETFYRGEMRQKTWLRVHVIPPLDGIYSQWDFNAGRITRFYNPHTLATGGVKVDGKNDEVFGNLDDPCNDNYDAPNYAAGDNPDPIRPIYRTPWKQIKGSDGKNTYTWCATGDKNNTSFPYHQSVDLPDPTVSDANASLSWSMVTGPNGTIVDRTSATIQDLSPGGAAQSVLAVPYYRDDSCFDDGTGSDPGVELHPRDGKAEAASGANGKRHCWKGTPAVPGGDSAFWQGSIATHGIHILFLADSDNARLTIPTDEIVAETRMVMLPGKDMAGLTGEAYGRGFEKPLGVAVADLPPALPGVPGKSGSNSDSGAGGQPAAGQTPPPDDGNTSDGGQATGTGGTQQTSAGGTQGTSGGSNPAAGGGTTQPQHRPAAKHRHKAKPKHRRKHHRAKHRRRRHH